MPRVRVKDGDREEVREILGKTLTFGRSPDNHIVLTDRECSRHHCYIEKVEHGYKMVDLESRNGTKTNGQFKNQHLLRSGDMITVGKAEIVFIDENAPPPPPSKPAESHEKDRTTGFVPGVPDRVPRVSAPLPKLDAKTATAPAPRARSTASRTATPTAAADSDTDRRQERKLAYHQTQQYRERQTLKAVCVVAGVFVLLMLVVIFLFLSGGSKSEADYVKALLTAADKAEREAASSSDPDRRAHAIEEAIRNYKLVPSTSQQAHSDALKKLVELGATLKEAQEEALGRRLRQEMDEIEQFFKSRQPPDFFGAVTRYERLLEKTPKSHPLRAEIQKRIDQVRAQKDAVPPENK